MGKIVDDGNACHFRLYFEPALHALECSKRLGDRFEWNLVMNSHSGRGGSVEHVVLAGQ